jgi:Fe-S-cluster containining protein
VKEISHKELLARGDRILGARDLFCFECRPDLPCFNLCCRNLNLYLYPYDVIRLRKRLGISSAEFIDRHAEIISRPGDPFFSVLLSMADNAEKTCPFLTGKGCGVYEDRPWACRSFPTEHGMDYDAKTGKARPINMFRPPDFCLGRHEKKQWTVSGWLSNQNALVYYEMTGLWADFLRKLPKDPWQGQGRSGPRAKMAFMAAYNMDEFRAFVFGSSFLKRFDVPGTLMKKIKTDDTALLRFGLDWSLKNVAAK